MSKDDSSVQYKWLFLIFFTLVDYWLQDLIISSVTNYSSVLAKYLALSLKKRVLVLYKMLLFGEKISEFICR